MKIFGISLFPKKYDQIHRVNQKDFRKGIVHIDEVNLIDVRTPAEYSAGHFEGAINVNFFDRDFVIQMEAYDKEAPLYLYCRSGMRSFSAAKKLAKAGFKEIYDLKGGIGK